MLLFFVPFFLVQMAGSITMCLMRHEVISLDSGMAWLRVMFYLCCIALAWSLSLSARGWWLYLRNRQRRI